MTFFPVHVVRVEFYSCHCPNNMLHMSRFLGQDIEAIKLDKFMLCSIMADFSGCVDGQWANNTSP
jgi:hypothetical protein